MKGRRCTLQSFRFRICFCACLFPLQAFNSSVVVHFPNEICVSCQYHLRSIAKIRKYLSEDASQILVHAFISSKLENCTSLLYGLPNYKHLLNRLRLIQNTASRIVTSSKWFDHIIPIRFKLHWLPLGYRIHFKIFLLVSAPRLWNQLPPELRDVTSVDQFRTQLKTYLFKLASLRCLILVALFN